MNKIGWLNIPGYKGETWNPIIGCTKVSEGCQNCWAEIMANRLSGMPHTKENYSKVITDGKWNGKTALCFNQLDKPLKWKKPRAIAVCLEGDLFHESVTNSQINTVFSIMSDCDQHIYILLTKRPDRIVQFYDWKKRNHSISWQPKNNIWFGVTVENQEQANKRIPILLSIPAAKRFVSIEPMLGKVNLNNIAKYNSNGICICYYQVLEPIKNCGDSNRPALDWVICGGESGSKARPMHPDWVRSLRNQCTAAEVPFFFKQWGEYKEGSEFSKTCFNAIVFNDGSYVQDYSTDLDVKLKSMTREKWNTMHPAVMARVGRKNAGCELDGNTYHEFPKL